MMVTEMATISKNSSAVLVTEAKTRRCMVSISTTAVTSPLPHNTTNNKMGFNSG